MRVSISRADAAQLIVLLETGLHRLEGLHVVREATDEKMWLDATHDAVDPIDSVSASLQDLFGMTFDEAEKLVSR